jgi:antitoxin MazE
MKVSKWGGSLAVRLPKELVEMRDIQEGDEVFVDIRKKQIDVRSKEEQRAAFLKSMEKFNWEVPKGYKFDREEANARGGEALSGFWTRISLFMHFQQTAKL